MEVVIKDISIEEVTKTMTLDRIEWRERIYAADLDYLVEDP